MTAAVAAWERFWFAPQETSTLAVFRIAFGLLATAWTATLAPDLLTFFGDGGILPASSAPRGVGWSVLAAFPADAFVYALFGLLLGGALCLTVGYRTRLAAAIVFAGLVSFERRNPYVFNSGDLLLRVLSAYLVLAPAGASLSLDRWRKARDRFWEFPARAPWALRLMQVQCSVIYLTAVWTKAQGHLWNEGTAVSYAFRTELARFPLPGFVTDDLLTVNLLTYGTLAVELALGVLVWNRKLRPWVLALGVALHLGIDYSLRVGFFSLVVLTLYLVWVPPETMSRRLLAVRARISLERAAHLPRGSLVPSLRPGGRRLGA